MERLKYAAAQAAVILILGCIIAFAHNALSVNGINPFRKVADVPIVDESAVDEPIDAGYDDPVAAIRVIDLERMKEVVARGDCIFDARPVDVYEAGHIPSALLVDYYEMGRYLDAVLACIEPDQEITIYCAGPECEDSELLARELYIMGYTNLLVFKGGYETWADAGLPVETGYRVP
jgi:rhodanese-related sulfurtransferase